MTRTKIKTVANRIAEANIVHDNKYNYELWTNPISRNSVVSITCPKHGTFTQKLSYHLVGHGCKVCARQASTASIKKSKQDYIIEAERIHGTKYDYSKVPESPGIYTKVDILCPIHGYFKQSLNHHIHTKSGCQQCGRQKSSYSHISQTAIDSLQNPEWLRKQNETKSLIQIAMELGVGDTYVGRQFHKFNIDIKRHHHSTQEREIVDYINSVTQTTVLTNNRNIIPPFELDIYLPEFRLAIEFCGIYWHSERLGKGKWYHFEKFNKCKQLGIKLLTIFEDEWTNKKRIIQQKLKYEFKCFEHSIYARTTNIVNLDRDAKKDFLNSYHIQGNGPSSIQYGLQHHGELVACIGFIKKQNQEFVLNRYATSNVVIGGFSRLLRHFIKCHPDFDRVVTFADLRWSTGDLYHKYGFDVDHVLKPDYTYVKHCTRFHKFNFRRKYLPSRLDNFDPKLSEKQNCDNNNILRIWDCGKIRFVLNNKSNNGRIY